MNKKELTTFNFPDHLLNEYQMLMTSKDDFLKKLPSAERTELETLYGRLTHAFSENNIEQLKREYETKLQDLMRSNLTEAELREKSIQKQLTTLANEEIKLNNDRKILKEHVGTLRER